jgi:hypothetical protein
MWSLFPAASGIQQSCAIVKRAHDSESGLSLHVSRKQATCISRRDIPHSTGYAPRLHQIMETALLTEHLRFTPLVRLLFALTCREADIELESARRHHKHGE